VNSIIKETGYYLLNLFTGGKGIKRTINQFVVKFPARWSRYYESNYEAANYNFLRKSVKPGMHIIDIGAHIGLFSTVSSQLTGKTGKVVAFEPTPATYDILLQTLQLNQCSNVIPVLGAVGAEDGWAVFYVSETEGCNSNSLVRNDIQKEAKENRVELFTIDTVVSKYSLQPGFIKIDAEGAELDVLKGGLKTFKEYKPILILGLHPDFIKNKGDELSTIWDVLQQSGYMVMENEKKLTKADFCSHELLFDVQCTIP